MSEAAKIARNEYMRKYRKNNKEKLKKIQNDYWERKVNTMEKNEKLYQNNLENLFILIDQGITGGFADIDNIEEKINTIGIEKFKEIFTEDQLSFLVGNLMRVVK